MSLQVVSVIGNATKDAEVRVSKDGVSYVAFRLAASNTDGTATFYNVLVFGHYGNAIKDHVIRGRQVFVNGRLQVSDKGYVSVVADHIELLARPKAKKEVEEEPKSEERLETKEVEKGK